MINIKKLHHYTCQIAPHDQQSVVRYRKDSVALVRMFPENPRRCVYTLFS